MVTTHVEFASEVVAMTCPICSRREVREAVLVNTSGLVLAKGRSCLHCGHVRHRDSEHDRVVADLRGHSLKVPA
ncbi:MAG TPA: hypothetical protein VHX38_22730 [Pseudonocardiaceae bacterium]|jgi:uncharacterized Zn finger protein|nr:hypothetical protein [Pseudonocardiaceae bacterium]